MKKHYETHVEDTDKLISVAGPVLDYKSWYEQYRKLMEEQAQRKYGLYTPTSEGDDDFPSISGMIARYSASGLTNEQMKENPVWVDKTGNGHDLQMKNFLWGGMSGVGGVSTYYDKKVQESCNITIEQIPEYEGYLVTDGVDDKITSSTFEMGNDWTVIGDWELINTGKNDNAGIVKFDSIVIYNYNPILINIKNGRNNLIPDQNTVNAICSDGRIYSKDWKESIYNEETESTSKNLLTIGYSGNSYTKIAFKNLAIYPTVLSKDDCIKAYNYLQTLKAK